MTVRATLEFGIREMVVKCYRKPRAAIVTAAAAGVMLGVLLKKCLPARTRASLERLG